MEQGLGNDPLKVMLKGKSVEEKICKDLYGKDADYHNAIVAAGDSALCKDNPQEFTDKAKNFFRSFDGHNAAIIMAINLAKINDIDTVSISEATIKNLMLNILFSVVFYVVYA